MNSRRISQKQFIPIKKKKIRVNIIQIILIPL